MDLQIGGWYPARSVTVQDGYFIANRVGTGEVYVSELLSLERDVLKFATAEGLPDNTIAVLSDHRELWVFGERSSEVWYNSGNPDFPFERIQGAFIEKGLGSSMAVAKMDNSVFWLGDDGVVYRALQYRPQRISTHAIEFQIQKDTFDDAFAYTYLDEGHSFFVITFPKTRKTFCYDAATNLWHERSDFVHGRHRSNCYAFCYGRHYVGDYNTGRIFEMNMDIGTDDGQPIRREAISPVLHASKNRAIMHSFHLDMETGVIGEEAYIDKVIEQDPPVGSAVSPGDIVTITVEQPVFR